jgi:hypothetical protein
MAANWRPQEYMPLGFLEGRTRPLAKNGQRGSRPKRQTVVTEMHDPTRLARDRLGGIV